MNMGPLVLAIPSRSHAASAFRREIEVEKQMITCSASSPFSKLSLLTGQEATSVLPLIALKPTCRVNLTLTVCALKD